MAQPILEMRDITKRFPGVIALADVNLIGASVATIHAICGENGAGKSDADEGAQRGPPARLLRRRDRLRGHAGLVLQHPAERGRRHRDHPSGARPDPGALHRREHLPRQRDATRGRDQLGRGEPPRHRADRPRRPAGEPADSRQEPRHRQAAARRDRQGAQQGGQAPHPRRADRGAERRRLPAPPRPAERPAGQGHHLDHDQPQAERDRARRRRDHHHPRRADDRDAEGLRRERRRGPHHPRHGRPRPRAPVPRPHPRHRRGDVRGPRLDCHAPAGPPPRGDPARPT